MKLVINIPEANHCKARAGIHTPHEEAGRFCKMQQHDISISRKFSLRRHATEGTLCLKCVPNRLIKCHSQNLLGTISLPVNELN